MDKRYQIFISSTFADLQDERRRVMQTILELDCFPAGMELFPAADEEQLGFIKKVIDDCDYYLLIIGGRYGSLTPEGISYTEKEYDYALERGLGVLAFLHGRPDEIPVGKSELNSDARLKLDAFRERVARGRLVRFWTSGEDLQKHVALSLSKATKDYPAIGWVRANQTPSGRAFNELSRLRRRVGELEKELEQARRQSQRPDASPARNSVSALVHKPRYEYFETAPVHVARLDKKVKVTAGILNLKKFTMLFWVDITEAFSWSDNNRYLFAYTSDIRDENKHPNAFYMGIAGNEQSWRLIVKGTDPQNVTRIEFPHSLELVGLKLISIRWNWHNQTLELDIDAGGVLDEERVVESGFWPQATQHEQMHIGGWFDTWEGGLSLLRFYHFRIYDVRLTDRELEHLYQEEQARVASRFTP